MNAQAITRMQITPFISVKRKKLKKKERAALKKEGEPQSFFVQANPETYALTYNLQYKTTQKAGKSGMDPKWTKNTPGKLSFKFLFDATGGIPGYAEGESPSVTEQIQAFKKATFDISAISHEPHYLLINWGTLNFTCRLENMTITYKLFAENGDPLRAEINASFMEVIPYKERSRIPKLQSPDITKLKTVNDGDSLPEMAEEEYGDVGYYMAIAQANKLIQFRNLKAGSKIFFPPIKKQ